MCFLDELTVRARVSFVVDEFLSKREDILEKQKKIKLDEEGKPVRKTKSNFEMMSQDQVDAEVEKRFGERMFAMATFTRAILDSPNFHSLNLAADDTQGAKDLVNRLVRLDRMPKRNTLEGLLLLQDAWDEYDISMAMAKRYKYAFKVNFLLQLVLGLLVIIASTIVSVIFEGCHVDTLLLQQHGLNTSSQWRKYGVECSVEASIGHAIFALSMLISLLVSAEGVFNAKSRWRVLRASACSLESIVWCFRTRVADFEVEQQNPEANRPERNLRNVLNDWRDELVSSAGLATSDLARKQPADVYKHFQHPRFDGKKEDKLVLDDHYSPTAPPEYITRRIQPTIAFYERRVPMYVRRKLGLQLLVIILGIAASVGDCDLPRFP